MRKCDCLYFYARSVMNIGAYIALQQVEDGHLPSLSLRSFFSVVCSVFSVCLVFNADKSYCATCRVWLAREVSRELMDQPDLVDLQDLLVRKEIREKEGLR